MNLTRIVDGMAGKVVLVVGDAMIDEYVHGQTSRMSPEAPVPVFVETHREERQGGAANVARQLEMLGCKTRTDFADVAWWCRKTRFMVNGHQLLRIDADKTASTSRTDWWGGWLKAPDAVVISDYAKGWCGPERCQKLIADASAENVPVVVDPKGSNWDKYIGCSIITPNEVEAKDAPVENFKRVLYKQGGKGMWLDDNGRAVVIPATAHSVADVTGAGDTVTAVLAAALAAGADYESAAVLANYAAGYVVGQIGTVSCPIDYLREMARRDDRARYSGKAIDYDLLACYTAP